MEQSVVRTDGAVVDGERALSGRGVAHRARHTVRLHAQRSVAAARAHLTRAVSDQLGATIAHLCKRQPHPPVNKGYSLVYKQAYVSFTRSTCSRASELQNYCQCMPALLSDPIQPATMNSRSFGR